MEYILEMCGITKSFGGVKANENVNLAVRGGEILGLLGENGAGKTTLMNVLYGLYKLDCGVIRIKGKEVAIENSLVAIKNGIGMIHQHFMLVPAFTVLENIILGLPSDHEPFLDLRGSRTRAKELAETHGLTIMPDVRVSELSTGLKQQVEILKMLYRGSNILILDEPTGVLTPQEMVELFHTLRSLAAQGNAVIIISHKLEEIMQISDRVSVLRRGTLIDTVETKSTTAKDLARMMVGRDVVFSVNKDYVEPGGMTLEVENLCVEGMRQASALKDVSFQVRAGEILGVAGVDGNGQSELLEALTGLRKVKSGQVKLDGESITNLTPRQIIKKKVAFVPEDRKETGVIRGYDIDRNLVLRSVDEAPASHWGLIDAKYLKRQADQVIEAYDVRLSSRKVNADLLSGGNLQKIILARELSSKPRLLLAMHPTRGLDVGAIEFVHAQILEARHKGTAVVIVSTELEEILTLSDRIIVLCDGRITGEVSQQEATVGKIGELMAGIRAEKGSVS